MESKLTGLFEKFLKKDSFISHCYPRNTTRLEHAGYIVLFRVELYVAACVFQTIVPKELVVSLFDFHSRLFVDGWVCTCCTWAHFCLSCVVVNCKVLSSLVKSRWCVVCFVVFDYTTRVYYWCTRCVASIKYFIIGFIIVLLPACFHSRSCFENFARTTSIRFLSVILLLFQTFSFKIFFFKHIHYISIIIYIENVFVLYCIHDLQ